MSRIVSLPETLVGILRRQAAVFPAIALAEANDIDGARELLARATAKKR